MYETWLRENGIEEKIFDIKELDQLNEDLLWEMATITPQKSGIPYKIWLDPMGVTRGNEHTFSPRLKIEVDGKFIPVEISDNPQIPNSVKKTGVKEPKKFDEVQDYIRAYEDVMLAHFYGKIDDDDATTLLKNVTMADEASKKLNLLLKNYGYIIEYYWDTSELIFVLEMKEETSGYVEYRDTALDRGELFKIITDLRSNYQIKEVKDLGVKDNNPNTEYINK